MSPVTAAAWVRSRPRSAATACAPEIPYGLTAQEAAAWMPAFHGSSSRRCFRTMELPDPDDRYVGLARCTPPGGSRKSRSDTQFDKSSFVKAIFPGMSPHAV